MPHRVGTCFHTGHCHLELNLYRANFTRQCMTTCQELSGYRSLLDTTQMCFRCMLHTVEQTSVPLRVDGNDVRRGTSPFGVGAVVVVGPHKRARKKLVLFECLLLGSGQISTVKWHWAIYFHANAINTNTKPTGFTNTLIHSKCWGTESMTVKLGPFFDQFDGPLPTKWSGRITQDGFIWPEVLKYGQTRAQLSVATQLNWGRCILWNLCCVNCCGPSQTWRDNKRGREENQKSLDEVETKCWCISTIFTCWNYLPFNSRVIDSIGQVIGPCESCHVGLGIIVFRYKNIVERFMDDSNCPWRQPLV